MNINRLKNISIVLMAFFAIFQTVQLWFEHISNRNFFYTFYRYIASEEVEYVKIRPFRIITSHGNSEFKISSSNLESNMDYLNCDNILENLISDGEFILSKELNWIDLLNSPSYIMEYGTPMPNDVFVKGYGVKSSNITSKISDKVDNIVMIPNDIGIRVVFAENETKLQHEFLLKDVALSKDILLNIEQSKTINTGLYYISSLQNNFTALANNVFIPRWDGSGYGYFPLYSENPYVQGEKHIKIIENNIMHFFENPAGIWSNKVNGVYTYSDKNRVVKYYDNDILEYNDFTVPKNVSTRNFMQEYSAAVKFLERDIYLSNYFYLADYDISEDDITFFFNYTINDLSLSFSSEYRDDTGMEYPIEITVANNLVTHYKRVAQTFYSENLNTATANLDFFGSLNSLFPTETDLVQSNLIDVNFAYKMGRDKHLLLYWFLNLDGILYVKST